MGVRSIVLAFALLFIEVTVSVLPDFPLDKRELEVRAGYYTSSGKYLGGIPHIWSDIELSECTEFNSDSNSSATTAPTTTDGNATATTDGTEGKATMCMSWTSDDVGPSVRDVGTCFCQSIASAGYCAVWTCSQPGVESKRCTCTTDDLESGNFCLSWTCVETDSFSNQASGLYQCVTPSSSSDFCEAWTGVIEGAIKIEMSACECVGQWDGVGVCSYWECMERVLYSCECFNSWCNISVSLGVAGFLGSWGAIAIAYRLAYAKQLAVKNSLCTAVMGFVWMLGWSAGVVIWGGQDGALYAGLWWGAIIVAGWLRRYPDMFATFRARVTQSLGKEQDAPTPN